jgi:hypothetical protein
MEPTKEEAKYFMDGPSIASWNACKKYGLTNKERVARIVAHFPTKELTE